MQAERGSPPFGVPTSCIVLPVQAQLRQPPHARVLQHWRCRQAHDWCETHAWRGGGGQSGHRLITRRPELPPPLSAPPASHPLCARAPCRRLLHLAEEAGLPATWRRLVRAPGGWASIQGVWLRCALCECPSSLSPVSLPARSSQDGRGVLPSCTQFPSPFWNGGKGGGGLGGACCRDAGEPRSGGGACVDAH